MVSPEFFESSSLWSVVLVNDPVNIGPLALLALTEIVNVSPQDLDALIKEIENRESAVVFSGSKGDCITKAASLMTYQFSAYATKC
jgi:ATP-dependent Clp protease adapter protein ClpS